MKNKLILFGLFFALLQAIVYGKRNEPDPPIIDEPLKINVDAGKERDSCMSLAKTIEEKQSLIDDALNRMTAKIEALEERITAEANGTEERWNQRMTAEAKATEERWNQRLSEAMKTAEGRMPAEFQRLNQKVVGLSNQLGKSTAVATPGKRPAELACEKITNELRSIGENKFEDKPKDILWLYNSDSVADFCRGNWIDKRFLITTAYCVSTDKYTHVHVKPVWNEIKEIHIHPDFSSETPSLNNIALIELQNDVGYTPERYPVCLYASEVNPKSDLIGKHGKVQIVADADCFNKTGTHLKPPQICAKNLEFERTFSGKYIYEVQENFPKHKLFGIVATVTSNFEPFLMTKVFDHLNFIESIVWPKSGN